MSVTKTQAQTVVKKIQSEANKLQPSSVITLYEIDLTDVLFERGRISSLTSANLQEEQITTFRFHNNINLFGGNIVFQGKTFYAIPISVTGLELSGSGTLPTPELTISTIEEASAALSLLKCQIASLSDLVSAKIRIKKTFAKHLDSINYAGRKPPEGYDPDDTAEFPVQIFYVDQKLEESKLVLRYRLSSILDLFNVKLPKRLIFANACQWSYRGTGCCYIKSSLANELHEGVNDKYLGIKNGLFAPPVMNEAGTLFKDIVGIDYQDLDDVELQTYDKGEHDSTLEYNKGDFVYYVKDLNYYVYVAIKAIPENIELNNTSFWAKDACTKTVSACTAHFGRNVELPYGGFASVNKLSAR